MDIENLNHMSRLELSSTLRALPGDSEGALALRDLLAGEPLSHGLEPGADLFNVDLPYALLEAISYGLEQYTYRRAEDYAVAVEEATNETTDDLAWHFWQALNEKWGYLEVMCDL